MAWNPKTGWRFEEGGVNLTSLPDSLPPNKYASLLNTRWYSPTSARTRPGYTLAFRCGNNAITDIQSYSALGTDNQPDFLARDSAGNIWLGQSGNNNGHNVGNMAAPQGFGAIMLPWRPSQSPQSWIYAATEGDYKKFSAPGANNAVTQYKVGIAEPQSPVDAIVRGPLFNDFNSPANWANNNAAGSVSSNSTTDTILAVFADSADASGNRLSLQVATNLLYNQFQTVFVYAANNNNVAIAVTQVQQVLPPINPIQIQAIRYASGNNGNCQMAVSNVPTQGNTDYLAGLVRGALVQLNANNNNAANAETVFVKSAITGPNGSVTLECSTVYTHNANEGITGTSAIIIENNSLSAITANCTLSWYFNSSTITQSGNNAATGTVELALASNPFADIDQNQGNTGKSATDDDYISMLLNVGNSSNIQQIEVIFNVGPSVDYTSDIYTYTITGAALAGSAQDASTAASQAQSLVAASAAQLAQLETGAAGNVTAATGLNATSLLAALAAVQSEQAGANELFQLAAAEGFVGIHFQISSLTRSGTNDNLTLANCNGIQFSITCNGTFTFQWGSLVVTGGSQPDVGDSGAPYAYQIVPRGTLTGAQGNPSPVMRYGAGPRRQAVAIPLPTVASSLPAADPQVNIWDVYRYGGSLTSYQYIGSGLPSTTFIDNVFDDTAAAGAPLPTQNFEPWPSVDVPWSATEGGPVQLTVIGTQIIVAGLTSWPATISRWLPGTLVTIAGQLTFTLRKRPVMLTSTSYLFDCVESIGYVAPGMVTVQEPIVARQINPYIFGPDANGTMFGVGDPLRPGFISYTSQYTPDAVPSTNNIDVCPPSEPLLGGVVIRGLSFAASSARWWGMYPAFSFTGTTVTSQAYTPYETSVGRGLAAPYALCTDGQNAYFVAKDCVATHAGGPFTSLTDADLYLLFPHEDVAAQNIVRNGVTYYAPDYSRLATFRLTYVNGFLKFRYQDSTGTSRTLICHLASGAWSQDSYANPMTCEVAMAQPEGALTTNAPEYYGLSVMGDNAGNVYSPSLTAGDNGADIAGVLGTFEWSGDPERNGGLFEDFYGDLVPPYGVTVQPVMFGQSAAGIPATLIGATSSRILAQIPIPDGSLNRYLGLQFNWTDSPGSLFTLLHSWRNFADPDSVYGWSTRKQTFGLRGYIYCDRMEICYSCTAVVTLNLTAFDGTSAATMTIPSTGGETEKIMVTPTANKGQLLSFSATSAEPFQLMTKDCLLWIHQWGDPGPAKMYPLGAELAVKP